MIHYQSFGAARQVTGSMHFLKFANGFKLLLDCGIDYERNEFGETASNLNFPFQPQEIDAVVLSHAHIDHSGNIPNLVRQGFRGKIYCTKATQYLLEDLWKDSLNIQMGDARKKDNKKSKGKGEVLYSERHILQSMEQIVSCSYNEPINLSESQSFRFIQAGHIIGAASVYLEDTAGNRKVKFGFTGDLGNYETQLVVNPQPLPTVDYLISESTYGGRVHSPDKDAEAMLLKYIEEVCVKEKGKLVIPAFSIGRTQAIIFTFHQLFRAGKLPTWLKIYTDSPMAIKSTRVYDKFHDELNSKTIEFYKQHKDIFHFQNLKTVSEQSESDYISESHEACVIVSAAGMMEGGRIQKHIRANIQGYQNAVLIAGYCSEGTLGDRLLQGLKSITISKKEKQVNAKIFRTDAFSAHADSIGLLRYYESIHLEQTKQIFLVHGEENGMQDLAKLIKNKFNNVEVTMPIKEKIYQLD